VDAASTAGLETGATLLSQFTDRLLEPKLVYCSEARPLGTGQRALKARIGRQSRAMNGQVDEHWPTFQDLCRRGTARVELGITD
jgi:hypothetical protein